MRSFLEPVTPLWRYCLAAVPIALIPSCLLLFCAIGILRLAGVDPDQYLPSPSAPTAWKFFSVVVFSPIVETYLLAGLLAVLSRIITRPVVLAAISACVWGGLHALFDVLWFFGTAWSFFVFSCAYMAWRKISFKRAYVAAAAPHALINLTAFIVGAVVA